MKGKKKRVIEATFLHQVEKIYSEPPFVMDQTGYRVPFFEKFFFAIMFLFFILIPKKKL
jgi:hypothetical protein